MQFSTIRSLTLAVFAASALALPAQTENTGVAANVEANVDLANVEASGVLAKRLTPVAILLINVIGGKLFAGAMSAGIEVAKEHIAPAADTYKDFQEARTAFMQENIRDLYAHREAGARGVICINGPWELGPGAVVSGPATEKFSWDIYHTTYDCFHVHSGSVTNKGDGGWINWGASGCPVNGKTMTC